MTELKVYKGRLMEFCMIALTNRQNKCLRKKRDSFGLKTTDNCQNHISWSFTHSG